MLDIIDHPANRPIVLRNVSCIYCGRRFGGDLEATKEHVIGRRFVPRGCFDGQWNLIANACHACNGDKAKLEDDISAITMQPDVLGRHVCDDPRLISEAQRKGSGATSKRTGKLVADSAEKLTLKGNFGPATITFTFDTPPQIEDPRTFRLAHYHWRGFFYWLTYDADSRLGGFASGEMRPLIAVRRADWGNPQVLWFMDLIRRWDLRLHAISADGFFKMVIRRAPGEPPVWAWASEWNRNARVFGFFGDQAAIETICTTMPVLEFDQVHEAPGEFIRLRTETALAEDAHDLFEMLAEAPLVDRSE